jgi:hypothetical protein
MPPFGGRRDARNPESWTMVLPLIFLAMFSETNSTKHRGSGDREISAIRGCARRKE